jgi:tRNA wybutosine-synthesizing protein 2
LSEEGIWAVDLYAGIGYFTFSYASMGMKVLCWEINPWSVEGLRRGAEKNRWSVKVIQGEELELQTSDLLRGGEQIVVFVEDNQLAVSRMRQLQKDGMARNIRHVNCGFLPTSRPVWRHAWDITSESSEAWLHLHENVGSGDTQTRRGEIQAMLEHWAAEDGEETEGREEDGRRQRSCCVQHVESVKTFAPGVEHVVFDVYITKSNRV